MNLRNLAAGASKSGSGREAQNHRPQGLTFKSLKRHYALWPLFGALGFATALVVGKAASTQLFFRLGTIFVNLFKISLLIEVLFSFQYLDGEFHHWLLIFTNWGFADLFFSLVIDDVWSAAEAGSRGQSPIEKSYLLFFIVLSDPINSTLGQPTVAQLSHLSSIVLNGWPPWRLFLTGRQIDFSKRLETTKT